ncbi:MAG: hypothetical protein IT371_20895 [Deltaproteobacteria bacterium]|nr:hypothetical protein [Deltaproteobacteria bacterium]
MSAAALQLSLLSVSEAPRGLPPSDVYEKLAVQVTGAWAAGERFVTVRGRLVPANVWIHLAEGGLAELRTRCLDQERVGTRAGRWWLDGPTLVLSLGRSLIRADFRIQDEVMYWAGEVLVRQPDGLLGGAGEIIEIDALPTEA